MKIILVANSTCTFVLQILYEKSAKNCTYRGTTIDIYIKARYLVHAAGQWRSMSAPGGHLVTLCFNGACTF